MVDAYQTLCVQNWGQLPPVPYTMLYNVLITEEVTSSCDMVHLCNWSCLGGEICSTSCNELIPAPHEALNRHVHTHPMFIKSHV